jgi:Flp pilus assembly CpaE family ATPase
VSDDEQPRLLLGLTPLAERAVEEQLFGSDAQITVAGSAPDAAELLALAERRNTDAVLLSPELPGLDSGRCAQLRSHGLRLLGLALDDLSAQTLERLAVDATLRSPLASSELADACTDSTAAEAPPSKATHRGRRQPSSKRERSGSVLAVVAAGGSPGASECAASLAALADQRWPTLLVELDLVHGGLALRLGADPQHGSLLGLSRAHSDDGPLPELLAHWVAGESNGWPPVLLAPPNPDQHTDELAEPGLIRATLDAAASAYPFVVVDVGALLALPGELPKVARVHREALVSADAVLLVIGAREQQLRAGHGQLTLLLDELGIPREQLRVVVSGSGAPGAGTRKELEAVLAPELAELRLAVDAWLPYDGRAATRARRNGTPLALARRHSAYGRALRRLLDELLLPSQPVPRERKTRLTIAVPMAATAPTAAAVDEEVALPWRS